MFGFAVVRLAVLAVLTAFPFGLFLFAEFTPPLDIVFVIREDTDSAMFHSTEPREGFCEIR